MMETKILRNQNKKRCEGDGERIRGGFWILQLLRHALKLAFADGGEVCHCGGRHATAVNMSEVVLKNVKKIYPNAPGEKKKKKKGEEPVEESKVNLQITDQGVVAVQNFNIDIADKEFIIFVGPSGCGKSTTLRMIAGLEDISGGTLKIDGKVMNDVEPKDRDIAYVFQNYAQ